MTEVVEGNSSQKKKGIAPYLIKSEWDVASHFV